MNVVDSDIPVCSIKKKKSRPDGTDLNQYKDQSTWPDKKWAWEFLRRNEEFINACNNANSGTDEAKQDVAKDFWLKKYKCYKESYAGGTGKPNFTIASISSWVNLNSDQEECIRLRKIRIGEGQVLIRFNVVSGTKDLRAIDKQLESAKKILDRNLKLFAEKNKKLIKPGRPQRDRFPIYLRILDHLASGKKNLDCAILIHSEMAKGLETGKNKKFDLQSKIKDQVNAAKLLAKEGYLHLLVGKEKPSPKK